VRRELVDSVQYVKGVGPHRAELLGALGVRTVWDLLCLYPRRYYVRPETIPIKAARSGTEVSVAGRLIDARFRRLGGGRSILKAAVCDGDDCIHVVWFNQPYLADRLADVDRVILTGKVTDHDGAAQMVNPDWQAEDEELLADSDAFPILPVYPATAGLSQKVLRRIVRNALDKAADMVADVFPDAYRRRTKLLSASSAIRAIHFPRSMDERDAARRRLIYEELFLLETAMALRRERVVSQAGIQFRVDATRDARIRRLFPFDLTAEQDKAVGEIAEDLASARPMNRLLQGDVGSGKTVVALYGCLLAVASRYQVAYMAPTEVLARQQFRVVSEYLKDARVKLALLVGAHPRRKERLRAIRAGEVDLVVGTHALIEQDVRFAKLGLVVVDEQHRFGVAQRAALRTKGRQINCLVLTATPIPRTLTLTVFGDLDVSTIDRRPPGRPELVTRLASSAEFPAVAKFVQSRVDQGEQAYVVCPAIDTPAGIEDTAAATYERLAAMLSRETRVGLLHGRLPTAQKEEIMSAFHDGKTDVLVATTVVEVGLDVANATVMVIMSADRFGLSQLHQLRGRVGRGEKRSYCILVADPAGEAARRRLDVLLKTQDGFRIAEEDLRLRGPGEFFGTRQHGLPQLKIANLIDDAELLMLARREAFKLVAKDPTLAAPTHRVLRDRVVELYGGKIGLVGVG